MLSAPLISRLRSINWDFSGNFSDSAFSSLHWHPGRFASQLPATLIGLLSHPNDTVLDPFMGSGTTLVEAQRLGRPSIGIDINPVSCIAAKAKTLPVPAAKIARDISSIIEDAAAAVEGRLLPFSSLADPARVPDTVQASKWYVPSVLTELSKLWQLIQSYSGRRRILAEAGFSALLIAVCRETRHWGYICDNTQPAGDHGGNPLRELEKFLRRTASAYAERDAEHTARAGKVVQLPEARILQANSKTALAQIPDGSVRLCVTSPPYFGVCDYVKAQRLSLEWFSTPIEPLRLEEVGARSKRHRRDARDTYLSDIYAVFAEVRRCLTSDGAAAVIIGQSHTRDAVLPALREVFQRAGLTIAADMNRRVTSQRRQAPSITGEHIMVLAP